MPSEATLAYWTLCWQAAGTVAIAVAFHRLRLKAGIPLVACCALYTLNRAALWLPSDGSWVLLMRRAWLPALGAPLLMLFAWMMTDSVDAIVRRRRPGKGEGG